MNPLRDFATQQNPYSVASQNKPVSGDWKKHIAYLYNAKNNQVISATKQLVEDMVSLGLVPCPPHLYPKAYVDKLRGQGTDPQMQYMLTLPAEIQQGTTGQDFQTQVISQAFQVVQAMMSQGLNIPGMQETIDKEGTNPQMSPEDLAKFQDEFSKADINQDVPVPTGDDDDTLNLSAYNKPQGEQVESVVESANMTEIESLVQAIAQLDPSNKDHYTNNHLPNAKVLSRMVGWDVNSTQRDLAYSHYQRALEGD